MSKTGKFQLTPLVKLILIINFGHNNRIHKKVQITVMITIKIVASLNLFGQGNYCTKNLCAMCTGTKADFSQCGRILYKVSNK